MSLNGSIKTDTIPKSGKGLLTVCYKIIVTFIWSFGPDFQWESWTFSLIKMKIDFFLCFASNRHLIDPLMIVRSVFSTYFNLLNLYYIVIFFNKTCRLGLRIYVLSYYVLLMKLHLLFVVFIHFWKTRHQKRIEEIFIKKNRKAIFTL